MRTKATILLLAVGSFVGYGVARGQAPPPPGSPVLHLLAASPNKHDVAYASELYRFDDRQKTLVLVRTLDTEQGGVRFILADYDGRRLVVGTPRGTPNQIHLIDMNAPAKPSIRKVTFDDLRGAAWDPWPAQSAERLRRAGALRPGVGAVSQVLLDRTALGRWLAFELVSDLGLLTVGFPLDGVGPSLPREVLTPGVYGRVRVSGVFGLADLGDHDQRAVHVRQGKVLVPLHGREIELPVPAPEVTTQLGDLWWLLVHNDRITVMHRSKDPAASGAGDGVSPLHVFTTQTGRWTTFRVPGSVPAVKAIGAWIMGAARSEAVGRESPGRSARRQSPPRPVRRDQLPPGRPERSKRPDTDYMFRSSPSYHPGVLFLIDTETGRFLQFRTDQGDSEILLVHENSVYYRVNNTLMSAKIQGGAVLGPPLQLATHEAVPDMHWAFMGY